MLFSKLRLTKGLHEICWRLHLSPCHLIGTSEHLSFSAHLAPRSNAAKWKVQAGPEALIDVMVKERRGQTDHSVFAL